MFHACHVLFACIIKENLILTDSFVRLSNILNVPLLYLSLSSGWCSVDPGSPLNSPSSSLSNSYIRRLHAEITMNQSVSLQTTFYNSFINIVVPHPLEIRESFTNLISRP